MADLPIVPDRFKLVVRDERSRKQMSVVTKQLRREDVEEVVNACDAGREGELIFAYLYEKAKGKKPVKRLWLNSMTTAAMKQALASLRPAEEFALLEQAARSRSEADWIVGMNATRAATIRLRSSFDGAVSLGRVQTPTLAIVARREEEIKAFVPEPYWLVDATFAGAAARRRSAPHGERATSGTSRRRPAAPAHQGPAASPPRRRRWRSSRPCAGGPGTITKLEKKEQREKAPMLYDLTTLQREANNRYGFSANARSRAAQRLYEEHKALTYPRTNSRYLTTDMVEEIKPIAELVGAHEEYRKGAEYVPASTCCRWRGSSTTRRSPTTTRSSPPAPSTPVEKMGADDRRVYDMAVRRFLAVFHPEAVFENTRIETTVPRRRRGAGHVFRTRGKLLLVPGWRGVYDEVAADAEAQEARGEDDEAADQQLPRLIEDEQVADRARSRARARKRNRRGATATPRCSARWRRPASSSTTTSCARR